MTDLRKLSAKLITNVEDTVSQKLGYRYVGIKVPGLGWLDPNPRVRDVTSAAQSEATYARWLEVLDNLPNRVYQARISKYTKGIFLIESDLRTKENWLLRTEGQTDLLVRPIDIVNNSTHYLVTLAVIKNKLSPIPTPPSPTPPSPTPPSPTPPSPPSPPDDE